MFPSLPPPPLSHSRFVLLSTRLISISLNIPVSNFVFLENLWKQGIFRVGYQTAPYMYHQEQSKGTGVFIPKCSQSRRRPRHPKQGRFSSFNAKQHHSFHQNRQHYQQNHEYLRRSNLTTHTNINNKSSMMITGNVHASIPRRTYRDAAFI